MVLQPGRVEFGCSFSGYSTTQNVAAREGLSPHLVAMADAGTSTTCADCVSIDGVAAHLRLLRSQRPNVSPWIVTAEVLLPFRVTAFPRDEQDPRPLPHLHAQADKQSGAIDIDVRCALLRQA